MSTTSTLTVNFSEAVTATASAFALECPAGTSRALAPWTSSPATSFVLTPTASLPQASSCVLTVAAAQVADGFGQHLSTNYTLNFTTNTLATVTSTIPANAATGVQPSSAITVNFSESVNATTASFTLQCPAGTPKAFTLSTSPATSFTLTPSAALPTGTACAVGVVAAQVTDTSGQAMAANYNFGFTVAEPPAITSLNNATFTVGNASSFTITTTGTPTVTSISMASVTPGPGGALPAGVSFSYTSGPNASLGGTPSNAAHVGTYVLSFTASNGVAPDAVQNPFTLTVSCPAISLTPSGVTFNATYGTPFSQAFTPAGGHAPYTYTLGGQALPGIAFSGNNLAGAPNNTGTFGFSVKAVDAYGCESATHSYMLNVDPKVGNDTFATTTTPVIGNVFVDSSRVPFSVLANDAFPAGATIIADATSHLGGNVSMTVSGPGMGQFTYDPPRGKTGDDYFRYSVVSNGRTVFGTVNITVANLVWFVDNTAACVLDCDGRQSHPYKTIAAFNAVNNGVSPDPQNGHAIFVYAGNTTTNYTGPLTLRASQKLFGQGSTSPLATLLGWSPGPGQVYPATGGTRPLLNGSGTATLTLGTGNTLNGLTLANSSGSGAALVGTSFGTLSIADLYIDSQGGGALNLNTGSVSGSFSSVKSTGGTNNVSLAGMSGNVTIASGQLTGASGNAFYVNGGNATIAYPGTIGTSGAAHSVNVANTTGGSVSFSGAITDNGGGIAFTGNGASSIINFTGGLTLRTAANPAFVATGTGGGNGTIYVTQDNTTVVNTIETTTGKAIEIAGVTIGGLTFRSINAGTAASGPANAIVINNTGGTAGLVVTGNGGACTLATPTCTGGQIQHTTGDAIVLTATNKTSLKLMNIHDNTGSGIVGTTMNGFTIDQSLVIDNGSDAATDDSGIDLVDLSGSAIGGANPTSITNTVIRNNYEFELQVTNGSGTLTDLQMSGNTISSDGTSGAHGNLVNFIGLGTANMKLTLTGGTFTGAAPNTATGVQCDHSGTGGAVTCNVSGATFTNNNVAVSMSEANGGAIKFNVANNVATGNRSHGLNLFVGASGAGGVDGTFSNNTVGTAGVAGSGSSFGYGIRVQNESAITSVSGVNVLVSGNTVQELLNFAGVNVNQGITGPFGSRTTNVTVTNNRVQHVDLSRAIIVQQNNATPGSYAGTTCVDISGNEMNNIAGVTNDGTKIRLRKLDSNGGVFNVRQSDLNALAAANSPPVGIASTTTTAAQISVGGTPTYNQPACPQPAP
ncbi:MAG: beta strand repeat-containing protein [Betaproteobacteria bacterium]